jgi:oxygen-independent coproporphyrinogen-3 oxidase
VASDAQYSMSATERELFLRLAGLALPRHTSYPAANYWSEQGASNHLSTFMQELKADDRKSEPLSIYLHLPFCTQLCFYCACNKYIVARSDARSNEFAGRLIEGIEAEIDRVSSFLGPRKYASLHLGGGTPTWLTVPELTRVLKKVQEKFSPDGDIEASAELDPRVTSVDQLKMLRDFGFNRVSLGVQDFDANVQDAINREQSYELVSKFTDDCRAVGFQHINFDLIYGLPRQTIAGMTKSIEQTISLKPTRIAFYRMAMIPEIFKWQRRFGPEDMPTSEACLDMNLHAINTFRANGYEFIGLDHFALKTDPLFTAVANGTVNRNFQGMTTGRGTTIVGFGPSAISQWPSGFSQNVSDFFKWDKIVRTEAPTERAYSLQGDDMLRRDLLLDLYCFRKIRPKLLAHRLRVSEADAAVAFQSKFNKEISILRSEPFNKLIREDADGWHLTRPLGELLVRVVAAAFDAHLPPDALQKGTAGMASRVG